MPAICIRVDAKSSYSGWSQVIRTISLARELSKIYYDVYFITKYDCSFEKIDSEGFNVFKITDTHSIYEGTKTKNQDLIGENIAEVKELVQKHNIETMIIDMPYVSEHYIKTYKTLTRRLVQIEDYPRFQSPANVIINGNLVSEDFDYPNPQNQLVLLGPEYCLIDYQIGDITPRKPRKMAKDVFIHIGNHDRTNFLPTMLKTLLDDESAGNLKYHIVVDSLYTSLETINELSIAHPNISLYNMPDNILDIMKECDIAISNHFFSIHRLIACGIPTISLLLAEPDPVYIDKTDELIESVWDHKYIGLVTEEVNTESYLLKKVNKLIESYSMRFALYEKGTKAIDGMGAHRVAVALKNAFKRY